MQNISSRINDAISFPNVKKHIIDNIGFDDLEAVRQWLNDHAKHSFYIYTDYIMTKKERAEFLANIDLHIQNGLGKKVFTGEVTIQKLLPFPSAENLLMRL